MRTIVSATATSSAKPSEFFARWVDHYSWSEWSPDSEWVRLDGPVVEGTTGTLKPKGAPKVRVTISELVPDHVYTDLSRLPGARLTFRHRALPSDPGTELQVEVSIAGPLAAVWALILGAGFRRSVPADLDRLVALVKAARV